MSCWGPLITTDVPVHWAFGRPSPASWPMRVGIKISWASGRLFSKLPSEVFATELGWWKAELAWSSCSDEHLLPWYPGTSTRSNRFTLGSQLLKVHILQYVGEAAYSESKCVGKELSSNPKRLLLHPHWICHLPCWVAMGCNCKTSVRNRIKGSLVVLIVKGTGAGSGLVYCGKRPPTYFSSLTCSVATKAYLGTQNFRIQRLGF